MLRLAGQAPFRLRPLSSNVSRMNNLERIAKDLAELSAVGAKLLAEGQAEGMQLGAFAPKYESWYTKALAAVTQIAPERLPEFREAYRHERRKEVTYDTYAVSDYLLGLQVKHYGEPAFNTRSAFAVKLLRQIGIVEAAAELAPSKLRDIRATLRAELLDSDLHAAQNLLKAGHLRSAGIVCGVVLETHLRSICDRHGIKLTKRDPSISDLNELLKSAGVYDVPMWRLIQRLADIRNICGHRKERDPKLDEVEDLLLGANKVTREIA